MTETREAEDWLIRYLVIGVVGVVATLLVLFGLSIADSLLLAAVGVLVLAAAGVLIARDLGRWRSI